MKKIILILVILLLVGVLGLRAYQSFKDTPAESVETPQAVDVTPAVQEETTSTPVATNAPVATNTPDPAATPYDPNAVLDLESLDEETSQEILQTEEEWASEGTGVGQLTPAGDDSTVNQQTEDAVIEIGEGQGGSLGF